MSDIFISYSSEDRGKAKDIAEALVQQGYSVWWDRSILPGETFDTVIEEALDAANCVIVLWSRSSVSSKWVKTEASEGDHRRILIPVLIDDVKIPLAFRLLQAADLKDWVGKLPHLGFDNLLKAVAGILGRPVQPGQKTKEVGDIAKKNISIEEPEKIAKQDNSIGMKFTLIPAGEFNMGSEENDDEEPVHKVKINNPFYLGTYPVTQREWKAVMRRNPSDVKGDDLPVESVSWVDVQKFIKKLNEKEGTDKYRLPSEAEWEYACRTGTTTRYSFGDDESELDDYAWYDENSDYETHPVGQKKPNLWGLYDMHGNVCEWVQDEFDSYDGAPTDSSAWESGDGAIRVIRGGSWNDNAGDCRSADRNSDPSRSRVDSNGFRLLKEEETENVQPPVPHKETITIEEPEKIAKLGNSIGMKFTLVTAGEFYMGSEEIDDEEPVHKVKINNPFYLGTYPVTQREWKAVMGDKPSDFKGDNLPVEQVSWDDVQKFIKKLNKKEGTDKYRLPSEAEWEYACRDGTTTIYSFGDDELKLGDYGWYAENSGSRSPKEDDFLGYDDDDMLENRWKGKTHSVGQKEPNSWGLFDMHGNVCEWVQDEWHDSYDGAPTDGSAWESGDGADRVSRGGGWCNEAWICHSAYRSFFDPSFRVNDLGFRILREL